MDLPAIEGGKPVRSEVLSFSPPFIDEREEGAVLSVLRSGWITRGKICEHFERAIEDYIGTNRCLVLNSATAGLFLSMVVSGIGYDDEVITTTYTFAATVNSIVHTGATPVLVDIEPDTLCISPSQIKKRINGNTRAVIPVHFGGHPAELDEIYDIADRHGLIVIEDAAHAIGSKYKDRKIGAGRDFAVFSFHAVKNLTTAEGGAVTLTSEDLYEKMKLYSLHGQTKDAYEKINRGGWRYDIKVPGYKFNMTDIQAAIGIEQLKKLDYSIKIREGIAGTYSDFFKNYDFIKIPDPKEYVKSSWHLYPLRIDFSKLKIGRDRFIEALRLEGISVNVHYIPVHMMSYYRMMFGYSPESFPVSYAVFKQELSLPIYPSMLEEDIRDVLRAFKKLIDYYYAG